MRPASMRGTPRGGAPPRSRGPRGSSTRSRRRGAAPQTTPTRASSGGAPRRAPRGCRSRSPRPRAQSRVWSMSARRASVAQPGNRHVMSRPTSSRRCCALGRYRSLATTSPVCGSAKSRSHPGAQPASSRALKGETSVPASIHAASSRGAGPCPPDRASCAAGIVTCTLAEIAASDAPVPLEWSSWAVGAAAAARPACAARRAERTSRRARRAGRPRGGRRPRRSRSRGAARCAPRAAPRASPGSHRRAAAPRPAARPRSQGADTWRRNLCGHRAPRLLGPVGRARTGSVVGRDARELGQVRRLLALRPRDRRIARADALDLLVRTRPLGLGELREPLGGGAGRVHASTVRGDHRQRKLSAGRAASRRAQARPRP